MHVITATVCPSALPTLLHSRRAAADLVRSLTERFPAEVSRLFTGYIGESLLLSCRQGLRCISIGPILRHVWKRASGGSVSSCRPSFPAPLALHPLLPAAAAVLPAAAILPALFPDALGTLFPAAAALAEYAANPAAGWRAKDCAIYMVTALSVKVGADNGMEKQGR